MIASWHPWPAPIRWADAMDLCREFDAQLVAWGTVNFSAQELWRVNDRRGAEPALQIPARALWPNMRSTIQLAQRIRNAWGAPVRVQCGYRAPAYNARVDGAEQSEHMRFGALDIRPPKYGPGREWEDFCRFVGREVEALRAQGVKVGFGKYHNLCFIHIDVGVRAHDWTEDIR